MENNDIIENKMPSVAEVVSEAFERAGVSGVEFYKHYSNGKYIKEGRFRVQSLGIKINGAYYLLPITKELEDNILNFNDENRDEISNLILLDIANRFALTLDYAFKKEISSSNDLYNKMENRADMKEIEKAKIINSNDSYNLRTLKGIYKNIDNSKIEIKEENKERVQNAKLYNRQEHEKRISINKKLLRKRKSVKDKDPILPQEQRAKTLDDLSKKEILKREEAIRKQQELRRQQKLRRRQELRRQQQEKLNELIEQIKKVRRTRRQLRMVSKKTLKTLKLIKNLEGRFANQKELKKRLRGILRRRGLLGIYNRLDGCQGEFSQRTRTARRALVNNQ